MLNNSMVSEKNRVEGEFMGRRGTASVTLSDRQPRHDWKVTFRITQREVG